MMYSRTDAVDEDCEDECEEDALSFDSASSASDDARAEGMVSLLSTDRSSRRNSAGTAGDDIPSSSADHRGDAARGGEREK